MILAVDIYMSLNGWLFWRGEPEGEAYTLELASRDKKREVHDEQREPSDPTL